MMDVDSKSLIGCLVVLLFLIACLVSRNWKKKKKAEAQEQTNNDTAQDPYQKIISYINRYLGENHYKFATSNNASHPQFKVHLEYENAPYEILITLIKGHRIDFAARVTAFAIDDSMLAAVAELTNRINTYSFDSQLNLNYESKHVEIHKSLMTFSDIKMFDWYFQCVEDGGRARSYLNQVLLEGESPTLVALDYAYTSVEK